ncbi:MAG: enoyl-CoA hydratase/isomerase family protein [Pseudomonadota bacterium]
MTDDVLFEKRGSIGLITLNRPKALNALNLSMIRKIHPKLSAWADDPKIGAVVIAGAGEKAFCSGGDVRAVYDAGLIAKADGTIDRGLPADFFREEYRLNHAIHTFPKPFIALVDGISMGGGVGLSVHGPIRVVTERLLFAMPETGIGLFPDVGGGWFLSRCPGELGTYYGLTGARAKTADALAIGYGTHHVPSDRLSELVEALSASDWFDARNAHRIIGQFEEGISGAPILEHSETINRCFAHDRVEDILSALETDGSDWGQEIAARLSTMSPTSMKVTLRQLRLGRKMSYDRVVTMEYRLSQACMIDRDFYEGIRAVLVDKDKTPRWLPDSLDLVSDEMVASYFEPMGARDLVI